MKSSAVRLCLAVFLASTASTASAQLLKLDEIQGKAEIKRGNKSQAAASGQALQADDVLTLSRDARVALRLGRHGLLELGPNSEIQVMRVPFATYADDLRTVVRLQQGYLRVIWKQPPLDINWPLFVYLDGDSAALTTGEYFFQRSGERRVFCSAEGQAAIVGSGRSEPTMLEADNCWNVASPGAGAPAVPGAMQPVDMDAWIAVRQTRALGALAQAPAAPAPTATTPAVSASPKPSAPAAVVAEAPRTSPAATTASSSVAVDATKSQTPAAASVPAPAEPKLDPSPRPSPVTLPPPSAQVAIVEPPRPAVVRPQVEAPRETPGKPSAPAPRPTAGGAWTLNIASFPDRASADQELRKVIKAGFPGSVAAADVKGKTWYRVQVQGLASRDEASDMATQLKSAGYPQTWVIRP